MWNFFNILRRMKRQPKAKQTFNMSILPTFDMSTLPTFGLDSPFSADNKANRPPVKLIEPSTGLIVELKLHNPNPLASDRLLDLLVAYGQSLVKNGSAISCAVVDEGIRLEFTHSYLAESVRNSWKE